jgi:hypothetical protein
MPNYVPPRLSNTNANSASPHSICTSPSYSYDHHQEKTNLPTLANLSHQAHIRLIDSPPCRYDGATFLSVLLNKNNKTITNKEDSINKEVVSTITQEEDSHNGNDNDKPLSTTTEVAIVCSPEMLRNPIELQWLLAPMIVGCYAIAVVKEADDHTTYSCVGELKTLALCKEEEVRQ